MMKNESGRSMVEMLGVLAIIGVLSVGGIAGYTTAMNKYRANENLATGSQCVILAQSDNAGEGITATKNCASDYKLDVRANTTMQVSKNGTTYTLHVTGTGVTNKIQAAMENAFPSTNKPYELSFTAPTTTPTGP